MAGCPGPEQEEYGVTTTATAQRGQGGAPLEARIVTRTAPHYRDVVGLYRRAFPRQEQIRYGTCGSWRCYREWP